MNFFCSAYVMPRTSRLRRSRISRMRRTESKSFSWARTADHLPRSTDLQLGIAKAAIDRIIAVNALKIHDVAGIPADQDVYPSKGGDRLFGQLDGLTVTHRHSIQDAADLQGGFPDLQKGQIGQDHNSLTGPEAGKKVTRGDLELGIEAAADHRGIYINPRPSRHKAPFRRNGLTVAVSGGAQRRQLHAVDTH